MAYPNTPGIVYRPAIWYLVWYFALPSCLRAFVVIESIKVES